MIRNYARRGLACRLGAITVIGAMTLAACGGDDDSDADAPADEPAESPETEDTTARHGRTERHHRTWRGASRRRRGGRDHVPDQQRPEQRQDRRSGDRGVRGGKPDIDVKLDTRPGGGEGDNLVKTRLSTGDMADVFEYNSGSLFQAIAPETNLHPITDEPWVADLDETFKEVVIRRRQRLRLPLGHIIGGGVFYNIPLYEKLGLEIPTTWDEFMANNEKIAKRGRRPVEQTFGDTWTSQIFVLADYHNVERPTRASPRTTRTTRRSSPRRRRRRRLPAPAGGPRGRTPERGLRVGEVHRRPDAVATGKAAHYPMITFAAATIARRPGQRRRRGLLRPAGEDAARTADHLGALRACTSRRASRARSSRPAKKFQAFLASPEGCEAQASAAPVGGPFAVTTCELPADVRRGVEDLAAYVDSGDVTPALEFLSPIKGPALEQITVEVGSGIRAARAARSSTTRTSRSRPSSSVSRAGNHTAGRPRTWSVRRGPGTPTIEDEATTITAAST